MEDSKRYLYGAAIQGIQSFILQSDELRDIVGASELIEEISTNSFNNFGDDEEKTVIKAAGNIKYIFDTKEECERAVLEFPKIVMKMAPGITVSQAVVSYENDSDFGDAIDAIEEKLKAQRNKQITTEPVYMSMRRSRQTGMPVVKIRKGVYLDAATEAKRKKSRGGDDSSVISLSRKCFGLEKGHISHNQIAYNIKDITDRNDWIAIIHADGNGLGQVVQKVGKSQEDFREFSKRLDDATKGAAQKAYKDISNKYKFDDVKSRIIPIRPVVLGGDDFTVICRADFAMEYTNVFLDEFEKRTKDKLSGIFRKYKLGMDKLTACAGIAYIKSSYPFHYGYDLAESLCSVAKKEARGKANEIGALAPSCIMFHKVQDSFVTDYKDIEDRELKAADGVSFKFGPYYLKSENGATVDDLLINIGKLNSKEGNTVKSHLRNWLNDISINQETAKQRKDRLISNLEKNKELKELVEKVTADEKIAAYDILSLHSIMYNQTKTEDPHD
jgi:hypothetical protein